MITLTLRWIDHEVVVEQGIAIVNAAIETDDPAILREYLCSLEFTPDSDVVNERQARYDKLKSLGAPDVVLNNELRYLTRVRGDDYAPETLAGKSLDELREILGTWCWFQNQHVFDWANGLDWYLQPAEGPADAPMFPVRPVCGSPEQTCLDQALFGSQPSPIDRTGTSIIRSRVRNLRPDQENGFGYNPPDCIWQIMDAFEEVEEDRWEELLLPQRLDLHHLHHSGLPDVAAYAAEELEASLMDYKALRHAYELAEQRRLGVYCEYRTR